MSGEKSVVVGVDPSGTSDEAVLWAAEEASQRGLELVLLHAYSGRVYEWNSQLVTPSRVREAAEQLLLAARDDVLDSYPTLTVHVEVVEASATDALLERAKTAELVVVGSHRVSALGRLFLGSTNRTVAARSPGPVAVIRSRASEPTAPIAVGVDGSNLSIAAVDYAFARADERHVPLNAVHAWMPDVPIGYGMVIVDTEMISEMQGSAEAELAESLAGWSQRYPDVEVRHTVVESDAPTALANAALHAQLLVVGSHGRGALASLVLGSVTVNLLHAVDTPTIIVRPQTLDS